jgi:acetyl/propionyl-CoA carboxylase alpha subunit
MSTSTIRSARSDEITAKLAACVSPARAHLGCNEVLRVLVGGKDARLGELASLPLGALGHRLVALRYFVANGAAWLTHFAWEEPLAQHGADAPGRARDLLSRVETARASAPHARDAHDALSLEQIAERLEAEAGQTDAGLAILTDLHLRTEWAAALRQRLRLDAARLSGPQAHVRDLVYLATYPLESLPATTVGRGDLRYVIVADKGEMGVRAVREAVAHGVTPIVVYSESDDVDALQVRLAEAAGGHAIALSGSFRETYANPAQIAERVRDAFSARHGDAADAELGRAALYPGYGPLAENTRAIQHFRRSQIVFVGPAQDSVERAGDKRKFRALAQSIDERAVTPGVVIDGAEPEHIERVVRDAYEAGRFGFPGRIKAANGGGGRGQVVVHELDGVGAAIRTVLAQISQNGWDPGVMFEQNIPETVHLEVQVVRDRYGNTRHFGMRDCTEQRASQKIQEEAPPALLRDAPEIAERCCALAVRIADEVGYVGACTVELMYKDGHVYLLEMNTRIQVEHPVTEEAHRIRVGSELAPLNLVRLQLAVAAGEPIGFAQEDVVATHVARELRINAEAFRGDLKDGRDGKRGLFVPNAGVFDVMEVPDGAAIREHLAAAGVRGIADLVVRFDVGFEVGDKLVNKDPTFGKLIVAVRPEPGFEAERYELLRLASLEVLRRTRIEGRQVMPNGTVLEDRPFQTNIDSHIQVLESETLKEHCRGVARERHVSWVIEMLRASSAPAARQ